MSDIMQTGDIITSAELEQIIEQYGPGFCGIEGYIPSVYESVDELGINGSERWEVNINYGYEVRFVLVNSIQRAWVTTGLCGTCDDVMGWVAGFDSGDDK